ncbi:MAG: hypothetical protein GX483_04525 [Actinomycetaceae bacterium]|nr:hypothetical protein [Actinomycetaceae bacterium]
MTTSISLTWKKLVALFGAVLLVIGIGVTALPSPASAAPNTPEPTLNGEWNCDADGECQYLDSTGAAYASTWLLWGGKWYYLGPGEYMYRTVGAHTEHNEKQIDGKYYRFDSSGAMITGWVLVEYSGINHWMYYGADGSRLTNTAAYIDGAWYVFNTNGVMQFSGGFGIGGRYYQLTASGAAVIGWFEHNGDWYYYGSNAARVEEQWVQSGGKWYYFGYDGKMYGGKDSVVIRPIGPDYYAFGTSGAMLTGWYQVIVDGKTVWMYSDSNGVVVHDDWRYLGGKWYYFKPTGPMYVGNGNNLEKIGDNWYRFTSSGAVLTGWYQTQTAQGKVAWNYHKDNGALAHGEWVATGGKWYSFADTGSMRADTCTGKVNDDIARDIYCFDASGAMITSGWYYSSQFDSWKYLGSSGLAYTGWAYINGNWYYFNPLNWSNMVAGTTFQIANVNYVFSASGAWTGQSFAVGGGIGI